MFGFFAANTVTAKPTKTAVDKKKRKRMAGRLPVNPSWEKEKKKNGRFQYETAEQSA
jgi:hypothetical protein